MKKQDNFQTQLQNPKWCKKQVKRLLTKIPRIFSILLFIICVIPVTGLSLILFLAITYEDPDIDTYVLFSIFLQFRLTFLPGDLMFLFFFLPAAFPLKLKNGKRIATWGNTQEIYREICTEFYDKSHPPKKSSQLWTTPHFILMYPYFLPKLYYLPNLTGKITTPKGDILHFSDGEKLPLEKIRTRSRRLAEEAIADYF